MGESGMSTKAKAARVAAGGGAVLSLGASLITTAGPAGAATFNVTTTADAGAGSLRQAILDANAAAGPDTITFQAGLGTIGLTSGQVDVTDDVTISDPEGDVTVDAGGTSRIFYLGAAGAVTLSGLTLQGGSTAAGGGAIRSIDTDLTLTDATLTGNASSARGGGLYASDGSLDVSGSTFTDNESQSNDGGGLHVDEALTVSIASSTFSENSAFSDGGGLSIYDFSDTTQSVTITDVTATGNVAADQGGGMAIQGLEQGTLSITGSTFTDNDAALGGGATLAFFDNAVGITVDGSTFDDNHAIAGEGGGYGGGLYLSDLDEATTVIGTSTFDANDADNGGGGINLDQAGTVSIVESTISNNVAEDGGGLFSSVTALSVTNSTISGNTADDAGGGIAVYGLAGTDIALSHNTLTGNTAGYGGGVVLGGQGTATLDHNLIDGNVANGFPVPNATEPTFDELGSAIFVFAGRVVEVEDLDSVTLTNNLVNGTIAGVVVDGGGNLFDLAANLGPLADNGGPTLTHDLLAGSAALDAGDAAFAGDPTTDQRGLPRVSNARIDIGAVEVQVQEPVEPPVPPAEPVPADPTFTG